MMWYPNVSCAVYDGIEVEDAAVRNELNGGRDGRVELEHRRAVDLRIPLRGQKLFQHTPVLGNPAITEKYRFVPNSHCCSSGLLTIANSESSQAAT